jgi:excinuclease ABC subunit A
VVPNEALSIKEGAVVPWAKSNPPSPYYMQVLASLAKHFGFRLETPWADLPGEAKMVVLYGTGKTPVPLTFIDGKKTYTVTKPFEGRDRQSQPPDAADRKRVDEGGTGQVPDRAALRSVRGQAPEARGAGVKLGDADISSITRLPVGEAVGWFAGLEGKLGDQQKQIAKAILKEINERLGFSTMWGWITSIWIAPAARCRAANRSASGWPADWQRAFGRALCAG